MFLLDTNVVSEMRKVRSGKADPNLAAWAEQADAESLFLSSITVMELELGILRLIRKNREQGILLQNWLDRSVLPEFLGRIFAVDVEVARRCARLHVPEMMAERDAWIAATALVHGKIIVTRNVADFRPSGGQIVNPWN